MKKEKMEFSKYEKARIIGARGLQVSMDAPLLLKLSDEELNNMNYDPLKIAEKELDDGVLPISVNRPMPKKKVEAIERITVDNSDATDEEKLKVEEEEEKEIAESGDMIQIAAGDGEDEVVGELSEVSGSEDAD